SQLLQARAMKIAIEAHRRNQPYNMGTLIWQLNDVWPVASWSGIDYLGNWKAMQYQTRRSYEPQVIWAHEEKGEIGFYGINDLPEAVLSPTVEVKLLNFKGEELSDFTKKQEGKSLLGALKLGAINKAKLLGEAQEAEVFLAIALKNESGETIANSQYFFAKPKELKLSEPKIKIRKINDTTIELTTDVLAKDVYLKGKTHFSDNFFDLWPGETKTVEMSHP